MWDLSSPTRDQTWVPCTGRQILNHWTTQWEVPVGALLNKGPCVTAWPACPWSWSCLEQPWAGGTLGWKWTSVRFSLCFIHLTCAGFHSSCIHNFKNNNKKIEKIIIINEALCKHILEAFRTSKNFRENMNSPHAHPSCIFGCWSPEGPRKYKNKLCNLKRRENRYHSVYFGLDSFPLCLVFASRRLFPLRVRPYRDLWHIQELHQTY